jgi:hypothetical protein
LTLQDCTIQGNGGAGVRLRGGAYVAFAGGTVTANAGAGVVLGDLVMVDFGAGTTVIGNGATDVLCNPQFSATRGVGATGGGTTNCVEP